MWHVERIESAILRPMEYRYDRIGMAYGRHRHGDPRIMRQIARALGDVGSVVDVGAGTGVYSPVGPSVIAVEPSGVMIAQRPDEAAPVVRALAGALPFPAGAFDAALATFTVHHWSDPTAGLREMRRVAACQVVLTFDQDEEWLDEFWLTRDYLPEFAQLTQGVPTLAERAAAIGARLEVVPVPWDCADGFFHAYWRRPHAYLRPEVRRATSVWARAGPATEWRAIRELRNDLRTGRWARRNAGITRLDEMDLGARLLIT